MKIKVEGDIICNDWKEMYEWYGFCGTCPNDVEKAINALEPGETLEVEVNSGGGMVFAGFEIYSKLKECNNKVEINIQSLAGSAASVIAMAGESKISPVGMLMIHNASSWAAGNKNDLEREAKALNEIDESIANAYIAKTGMTMDAIKSMMDDETWMSAQRARELGFVDKIEDENHFTQRVATATKMRLTPDKIKQFETAKAKKAEADEKAKAEQLKAQEAKAEEERKAKAHNLIEDLYLYGV